MLVLEVLGYFKWEFVKVEKMLNKNKYDLVDEVVKVGF